MTLESEPHPRPVADPGRGRAVAALVAGACVIGVAPILVRLSDTGPAAAAFWRLTFALPLLALLASRGGDGLGRRPSRLALLAGVFFALDLGFWHYGIANTSVANATILTNITPVIVTIILWLFRGQTPSRLFLVAVALAVGGASLLALAKSGGAIGPNPALGDALSVATAVWYALYFLTMSAARRDEPAARAMFWSTVTGVPLLLGFALVRESIVPASSAGWAACIGLGVTHVAGQGSIAWALGRLPPSVASVTVLVQPVVAALLGWLVFDEVFGGWQLAGGAIALSGVVLAQFAARRHG